MFETGNRQKRGRVGTDREEVFGWEELEVLLLWPAPSGLLLEVPRH